MSCVNVGKVGIHVPNDWRLEEHDLTRIIRQRTQIFSQQISLRGRKLVDFQFFYEVPFVPEMSSLLCALYTH